MTVLLAALLDWALGEPPRQLHPVVAMGSWLEWSGRAARSAPGAVSQFASGAVGWLLGAAGTWAAATGVRRAGRRLPCGLGRIVEALVLSTLFSARMLHDEVAAVEESLRVGGTAAGRTTVARLVSRDVTELDDDGVRQAALESLMENLSDSVVAPLLWHAVAGLPGAALYRYANTADGMWGYHGEWEWAGKVAARIDDLANVVPARLTAALITVRPPAWRVVAQHARVTPSPNAGYPMAALALRLGVRLEKRGTYVLNPEGRPPGPHDTLEALRRFRRLCAATVVLAAAGELVRVRGGRR